MLNDPQRKKLLAVARLSIEAAFFKRRLDIDDDDEEEAFLRPAGAFVTLRTHDGELRGCIGSIVAREPLIRAVIRSALNAAFEDPRFVAVSLAEMEHLELEI